jgi:hypothetical protein
MVGGCLQDGSASNLRSKVKNSHFLQFCCRLITLHTVQGYFRHAQQRSDAIRVMEPDIEVRFEVLSPTPHRDMRW